MAVVVVENKKNQEGKEYLKKFLSEPSLRMRFCGSVPVSQFNIFSQNSTKHENKLYLATHTKQQQHHQQQ